MIKKIAKKTIVAKLGGYLKKLRSQHDIKVIAVVGSIGKTSTKFAIANVLGEQYRVRFQEGNYNDLVTVPLVFFGLEEPSLFNPAAWTRTFAKISRILKQPYPYDIVVVELGVDGIGQMEAFSKYLQVDMAIVTAITPEHMENFPTMDAVAKEELSVAMMSGMLIANLDFIDDKYLQQFKEKLQTYGTKDAVDYLITDTAFGSKKADFTLQYRDKTLLSAEMEAVSIAEVYSATAAAIVGHHMNVPMEKIRDGILKLQPVSGRMQRLEGINDSLIIDETYNASPEAVRAALDSLYEIEAPQKIAILGNMNELGHMSEAAHRGVGEYCEPSQLDLVVTIGQDANRFLAETAKKRGCSVKSFNDPYAAGEYVKENIKPGAIVLAKGSQNGVFAEESIKQILKDPHDVARLVRQSESWLKKKEKQFGAVR